MPILLVEDDGRISSFLSKGLEAEGYSTVTARTVEEAEGHIAAFGDALDLVLLDLGLPAADGTDVLRRLRSRGSSVPVIILTARAELADKVRGLDAGANDYVTKPFEFDELLARVRAALRSADHAVTSRLEVGDLSLDLLTKMASRAGRQIELAPREWALLELFMRHPTQIFSRAQILSRVWDYSFDPGSNIVDVYVGYLRRKLNRPGLTRLIQTVRGAGYRLLRPE